MHFFHRNPLAVFSSFAILYFIVIIASSISLPFVGISGFAASPYISIISISFTLLYFFKYFLSMNIFLNTRINFKDESGFVFLWLFFTILSMLVGLVNSNPIVYIVTNFLYILIGYMLFCVTVHIKKHNLLMDRTPFSYQLKFIKKLAVFLFFISTASLIIVQKIPSAMSIFMLSLGLVFFILRRFSYSLLLFVPVLVQVPLSNRALLVSILLCVVMYIYRIAGKKKFFQRYLILIFLPSFILLMFYGLLVVILQLIPQDSPMFFRLNQLILISKEGLDFTRSDMISIAQRVLEARLVIDNWLSSPFNIPISTGLGSVIDGDLLIDKSVTNSALLGTNTIHNIHILPFALIHKYGLLGIVIFTLLILSWIKSFKNILDADYNSFNITFLLSNIFFCLWFVYSLPASNFLWTSPIFWISCALKSKAYYPSDTNRH